MIIHQSGTITRIIAKPNRSASWRANKLVILAIGALSAIIAGGFWVVGAWVILPFAGLEIAALAAALYYVNWQLEYRHVLSFSGDNITIEKGFYRPRQSWRWSRAECYLVIQRPAKADDPALISVCRKGEAISFGEFLNQEGSAELIALLRQTGLAVHADTPAGDLKL